MQAILTDLDGTLLQIDMDGFIRFYLKEMKIRAVKAGLIDMETHFIEQILKATSLMAHPHDLTLSNEEVFMSYFFSDSYYADRKDALIHFLEGFYRDVFPTLQYHSKPFPFSRKLVGAMFETGLPVVVATTPLFPLAALQARLEWAGVSDFPWSFITGYETMHSCKPMTAYYEETAAKIGVKPEECIMIGNGRQSDLAAAKAGMATYLLTEDIEDDGSAYFEPTWQGNSQELIKFLKTV